MDKINQFKVALLEKYPQFSNLVEESCFDLLYNFLLKNKEKLIWAIEELNLPPIEGVGKSIMVLKVDFTEKQIRQLTGAMIAQILSDRYIPYKSGKRVRCKPFITSSTYIKKA